MVFDVCDSHSGEFEAFSPFPEDDDEKMDQKSFNDYLLEDLNEYQRKAVLHFRGPLQILAAAGSGKTRVITRRIAYLINRGIRPSQILGVTFTNKAASEMRKRVENLVNSDGLTLCTFHSFCVRVLRSDGESLEIDRDFVIYDREDQKSAMKKVLKDLTLDPHWFKPAELISKISMEKSHGMMPADIARNRKGTYDLNTLEIFEHYQRYLRDNNAVDFDDLLLLCFKLFNEFTEVLEKYRRRYRFVLVDEFQDTNKLQYDIVKLLCAEHKNICVTGDPDQAIYSWRGADVGNIVAFEKDFKNADVVLLPKNYRSMKKILQTADSLIEHNINRKPKRMITDNEEGENVIVRKLWDEEEEAAYVCRELLALQANNQRLGDCAVFYRTNAQSRTLEKKLIEYSIPYTIVKGLEFFQRKEIKDIIAYLRLIHNPRDMVSLMRIVNTPTRKIGAKTIGRISQYSFENNIRFDKVFWELPEDLKISKRSRQAIKSFILLIEDFKALKESPVGNLINFIILSTEYDEYLQRTDSHRADDKIENIQELITDADKFEEEHRGAGLGEYLEQIALLSDSDKFDQIEDKVNLLTLHTAKGLEFPTVFIVGLEEGVFPHSRVIDGDGDLEEERRLCYVGITRTEKQLYMTFCEQRTFIGRTNYNEPSRFLDEIDKDCVSYFNQHNEQVPFTLNTISAFKNREWKYDNTSFDDKGITHTDQVEQNNNELTYEPDSHELQYNPETNKYEFGGGSKIDTDEMMFEPEDFSEFSKGDRIFHEKFGKGNIEDIYGKGNNIKAQILFDDVGMKIIVLSFAKLKRIM